MMPELNELKRIVAGFDNDGSFERVTSLERALQEAIAADNLAEHVTIKAYRGSLESEIRAIDTLLTTKYSKDLSDRARDHLLDRKELYTHFLNLFSGKQTAKAEKAIKDQLKYAQTI